MTKGKRNDREVEIKLAVADAGAGRTLLRGHGFRILHPVVFEANTLFDTHNLTLRAARTMVRLRKAGAHETLTYKGPPTEGRHKSREEIESRLNRDTAQILPTVLSRLGFDPVFRYQKFRTEFCQPGVDGIATLDETPIGVFLELEGAPRWIDRTARILGFTTADYITASYAKLYVEWCERQGITPGHMVFPRSVIMKRVRKPL